MSDDPYAQKVFSELLKQAIAEADALFDHPLKQYALFKSFEEKMASGEIEGIPEQLKESKHARAYYGVFHLVLGDEYFENITDDEIIDKAVSEYSLNTQNIEAAINKGLLPGFYKLMGMDKAKQAIENIIQITRHGLSRNS